VGVGRRSVAVAFAAASAPGGTPRLEITHIVTEHNKLVRDNIPAICEAKGEVPEIVVLTDDTVYLDALYDKLDEEAAEVREAEPDDRLEELADVLEVIRAIGRVSGYDFEAIEAARARKYKERGGFDGRIFLVRTSGATGAT
jgi:predicted house-cleaning noncanonical NTP pyrophosphatase (MazG superfamily)